MKNIEVLLSAFELPSLSPGGVVTVNAVLIIRSGSCYLVPRNENYESLDRLELYCPDLEIMLDDAVGGWVGGPANYNDNVIVTGVINKGTTSMNPISISQIEKFKIIRDGEIHDIIC